MWVYIAYHEMENNRDTILYNLYQSIVCLKLGEYIPKLCNFNEENHAWISLWYPNTQEIRE